MKKPNYGIDAPGVVAGFTAAGLAPLLLCIPLRHHPIAMAVLFMWGCWSLIASAKIIWGSVRGKLRERERLLDTMTWNGDEQVLDVGCGRGLFLIGMAQRLKTGRAFGVDLWQTQDQSGNRPEATRENARRAGVEDRIEILTGDMRKLPFPDGHFDVISSSMAVHNIPEPEGRAQALAEMARVLKPEGRLLLLDILYTEDYVRDLAAAGLRDIVRSAPLAFGYRCYTVTAAK